MAPQSYDIEPYNVALQAVTVHFQAQRLAKDMNAVALAAQQAEAVFVTDATSQMVADSVHGVV